MQTHRVSISFSARPAPQLSSLGLSEWCPLSWSQCPAPTPAGAPLGEGRRTPRHCLLQELLRQQLPLCRAHCSWGKGRCQLWSWSREEGTSPAIAQSPQGDPLHPPQPRAKVCSLWAFQCPGLSRQQPVRTRTLVFPQASVTWAWAAPSEPTSGFFPREFQVFVTTAGTRG